MSAADDRAHAFIDALENPKSPDNMDVRLALLARVKSGEITLADAQERISMLANERRGMQSRGEL